MGVEKQRGGPVSRVLYRRAPLRRAPVRTIYLGRPSPAGSCSLPAGRSITLPDGPSTCCSALLLARFTVPSPSPATRWALTPPFHPHRRAPRQRRPARRQYVFCGTVCPRRGAPRRGPGVTRRHALTEPGLSSAGGRPTRGAAAAVRRPASQLGSRTSDGGSSIPASSASSASSPSAGSSSNIRSSSSNSALEASKAPPSNSSSPP